MNSQVILFHEIRKENNLSVGGPSLIKIEKGNVIMSFLGDDLAQSYIHRFNLKNINIVVMLLSDFQKNYPNYEKIYTGFLLFESDEQIESFFELREKFDFNKIYHEKAVLWTAFCLDRIRRPNSCIINFINYRIVGFF